MDRQEKLNTAAEALVCATERANLHDISIAIANLQTAWHAYHCTHLMTAMADMAVEIDQLRNALLAEQASHATTRDRLEQERGNRFASTNSYATPITS